MKNSIVLKITYCCFFLIAVACKKEQPNMTPLNQNCDCAQEVTADFYMEEMGTKINSNHPRKSTDTDTMYAKKNIWFHPVEKNAEYTWYLGLETLQDTEVFRHFGEEHVGHTYPMTLVVRKKPNTICFPNDDGYDSIVRYLTVTNKLDIDEFFSDPNYRFEGVFRLKDSLGTDSIDITLELKGMGEESVSYPRMVMDNLDGKGSHHLALAGTAYTYRQHWFRMPKYNIVRFLHKSDGTVELEMIPHESHIIDTPTYHFKGRKLH